MEGVAAPTPPSVRLIHDARVPCYRLHTDYSVLALEVPSIIDQKIVDNVQGLPVEQMIASSPSGKTCVIYENMSVASPDYQHLLLRWDRSTGRYDVFALDVGVRRSVQPGWLPFPGWPSIGQVNDRGVELLWSDSPKVEWKTFDEIDTTPVVATGP